MQATRSQSTDAASPGKRTRYDTLRGAMWTDRASFDVHWRELGEYLLPRRTRFWAGDRNKGDKRNQKILDSTGRFAARTLSSGLHAGLTSPARPWMRLTTPDPDLAEFGPVKVWLHLVTQRILTIFLQSNLYNALPLIYGDMGVFGTAAAGILGDNKDLFRAYTYPIGSYALGLDRRGMATTFVREYELTVRALVGEFGGPGGLPLERGQAPTWGNFSPTIKTLWDRGSFETPIAVSWMVLPNDDARADRFEAKHLPWASCHYETGADSAQEGFLRESGFSTFPILAPRWDVNSPEDVYGTDCPGMTALGDIKQLQGMQRKKAQGIAKQIDPPLVGPSSLRTQKTSLLPGDITYQDVREGQQGLRSIHDVNINLADMTNDIQDTRYLIRRAFYEDLFLMLAQDQRMGAARPTAREVEERHEEKLLALGPVLERTNDELLDPLVDRTYALMEAAGLVPDPPEELDGVVLKVEYISILAQAQKLVGVVAQDRLLQSVVGLAQAYPEVLKKLDIYQVVDNYGEMYGTDPRLIRPTEDAQQLVAAEAQRQQAQLDAEHAKTMAEALHQAGTTPMDGDTALTRMAQGAPA